MEPKDLMNQIKKGESDTIEFKETFTEDAIQSIGAFANTNGGNVFIGVDQSGKIKGATISNESLKNWSNRISQLSEPTLIPSIYSIEIDKKSVIIINIKEFPLKPVAIRGRCYIRVGSSNRRMTPAEISEMHLQSIGTTWDATPVPDGKLDDIDLQKVKNYVLRAKDSGRRKFQGDENLYDLLRKLNLVKNDTPLWASIIAFGENPPLETKVKCGKIRGTSTIVDDFVVDTHLLDQVEEVMNYMRRVFQLSYSITGKAERDEIWEYPLEAVREVVTNAICHKDYSSPAQIQIKIFDDKLSIWNPGRLPFGMSIERLMDPTHNSIPRNMLLAMLFYDVELIENYGSGIQRILEECKRLNFPVPEFKEVEGGFQVIFYKDIYNEENLIKMRLNERQIRAIQHIREKEKITNKEYQKIGNISRQTATRELSALVEMNIIDKIGVTGKGTYYKLINDSQTTQRTHKRLTNDSQTTQRT